MRAKTEIENDIHEANDELNILMPMMYDESDGKSDFTNRVRDLQEKLKVYHTELEHSNQGVIFNPEEEDMLDAEIEADLEAELFADDIETTKVHFYKDGGEVYSTSSQFAVSKEEVIDLANSVTAFDRSERGADEIDDIDGALSILRTKYPEYAELDASDFYDDEEMDEKFDDYALSSYDKGGEISIKQTKKIAEEVINELQDVPIGFRRKMKGKYTLNPNSLERGSFDLDLNGEEYEGGSYYIKGDEVILASITPQKPVYNWKKKYGVGGILAGFVVGGYAGYKYGLTKRQRNVRDLFSEEKKFAKDYKKRMKKQKEERKKRGEPDYTDYEEVYAKGGDLEDKYKVRKISQITGGMNPKFRIEFNDGFKMRSDEQNEFIDSRYYKSMNKAIYEYEPTGTPIGPTSHEDLYNYAKGGKVKKLYDTKEKKSKAVRKKGNIITFKEMFYPRGTANEGYTQIMVTGFEKQSGSVKIEGRSYDSKWYNSMDDLIKDVDWKKMEEWHSYAKGGDLRGQGKIMDNERVSNQFGYIEVNLELFVNYDGEDYYQVLLYREDEKDAQIWSQHYNQKDARESFNEYVSRYKDASPKTIIKEDDYSDLYAKGGEIPYTKEIYDQNGLLIKVGDIVKGDWITSKGSGRFFDEIEGVVQNSKNYPVPAIAVLMKNGEVNYLQPKYDYSKSQLVLKGRSNDMDLGVEIVSKYAKGGWIDFKSKRAINKIKKELEKKGDTYSIQFDPDGSRFGIKGGGRYRITTGEHLSTTYEKGGRLIPKLTHPLVNYGYFVAIDRGGDALTLFQADEGKWGKLTLSLEDVEGLDISEFTDDSQRVEAIPVESIKEIDPDNIVRSDFPSEDINYSEDINGYVILMTIPPSTDYSIGVQSWITFDENGDFEWGKSTIEEMHKQGVSDFGADYKDAKYYVVVLEMNEDNIEILQEGEEDYAKGGLTVSDAQDKIKDTDTPIIFGVNDEKRMTFFTAIRETEDEGKRVFYISNGGYDEPQDGVMYLDDFFDDDSLQTKEIMAVYTDAFDIVPVTAIKKTTKDMRLSEMVDGDYEEEIKGTDMDALIPKGTPYLFVDYDEYFGDYAKGGSVGNKINIARAKSHFKQGEQIVAVDKKTGEVITITGFNQFGGLPTSKYDYAYWNTDYAKGGKVHTPLTLNDWKGLDQEEKASPNTRYYARPLWEKLSKKIKDRNGYGSMYSYEEKLTKNPNRNNNGLEAELSKALDKFGKNAQGGGVWNFIYFNYPSTHKYRKWMKEAQDIENFDRVIGSTDKEATKHQKLIDKLIADKQLKKEWKKSTGGVRQHWYAKGGKISDETYKSLWYHHIGGEYDTMKNVKKDIHKLLKDEKISMKELMSETRYKKGAKGGVLLNQTFLSSEEYQKAKKLKDFKKENYKWNLTKGLYERKYSKGGEISRAWDEMYKDHAIPKDEMDDTEENYEVREQMDDILADNDNDKEAAWEELYNMKESGMDESEEDYFFWEKMDSYYEKGGFLSGLFGRKPKKSEKSKKLRISNHIYIISDKKGKPMIKGESSRPATSRKEAHEQLKKSLQDNIDSGYYEDGEKIEIFTPKQYKESKYFKKGYAKGGEIGMSKEEKIKELEEVKAFLKTATDEEDIEQAKLYIEELENEIMYNYAKGGTIRKGDYVEDYGDIGLVNKVKGQAAYVKFDGNPHILQPVQISELKKKGTHKGKDLYILP